MKSVNLYQRLSTYLFNVTVHLPAHMILVKERSINLLWQDSEKNKVRPSTNQLMMLLKMILTAFLINLLSLQRKFTILPVFLVDFK